MKRFLSATLIATAVFLTGCKDKTIEKVTYIANVPVYMSYADLHASIGSQEARTLENPGKIYFYQHYIFINERYKGIHIINNLNPAFPQKVGFINIPANMDMAIKGNTLYADTYTDLLAIDITDVMNVSVLDRDEKVFPYILPPTGNNYPIVKINEDEGVVVGWEEREVTETTELNGTRRRFLSNCMDCEVMMDDQVSSEPMVMEGDMASGGEVTSGIGGSMARFTLVGDYLYTVSGTKLSSFDISTLSNPSLSNTIETWMQVETLFPAKEDKLFIGTTTGMLIYDLSNPASPQYLSQFDHMRNCDPVVVQGDYAYVTLRTGTDCGGADNELDVINISDIANPVLEATYFLNNPHGLGIDNNVLFVCDGDAGLKVYDASDIYSIDQHQLAHFSDIRSFDVIPLGENLLMIGKDGFYQYDYSDVNNIQLISTIRKGE